jgi:beta-glucosidase
VDAGYLHGVNAPGHRNLYEAPLAAHNVLRAHAEAVRRYRGLGKHQIGLVVDLEPKDPASDDPADLRVTRIEDAWKNRCFLDAVFTGAYPAELREMFGEAWPEFPADDFAKLREPFDFLGINYYMRRVFRHDPAAWPTFASPVRLPGVTYTETDWGVHPEGLTRALVWVKERYGDIPLYITENGAAFPDPPRAVDGRVEDPLRVAYLRDHLLAARDAMAKGVDLRGYFAWSLLDNFEWASGTTKRLGIVHVDFESQRRTIKSSGAFYRDVIRSGGEALGEADTPV